MEQREEVWRKVEFSPAEYLLIEKVAKGDNLSTNEAVCFALTARYFKRITAHLSNIATSVVLPLSELDYFDEKRRAQGD